ncbi:MAG: secondary thiamine-phosphate synthase enzyme YjbQ [Ignavibacterium sp.]|uniref:secondary thiamine-phosphate synthase enzyme YjbQ n=1 Tax=Ignavibacterium sp. TaxID=2651167 RepID=UPI0040491159
MILTLETFSFVVKTKGNCDIVDITDEVEKIVRENHFTEGSALIFVSGSTAAITTIEYEPGLLKDYPKLFEKLIPENESYHHNFTWHDGNGHSHLRASLQKSSFTVPFKNLKLLLGTWQQLILVDFDNRSRNREVIVQLTGIKKTD